MLYICINFKFVLDMNATAISTGINPQTEALWTLILGQGKEVQEAIFERLSNLFGHKTETPQQQYVRESLTRAIKGVEEAKRTGKKLKSVDEFIAELDSEDED